MLHGFAQKRQGCLAISPLCNEGLKNFSFMINGSPQIMSFAIDPYENLIQMPAHCVLVRICAERFFLISAANAGPNRFIVNVYATFVQHVLNLP